MKLGLFSKGTFHCIAVEVSLGSRNCFHTLVKLVPREQCSLYDFLVVMSLSREGGVGRGKISLGAVLIS